MTDAPAAIPPCDFCQKPALMRNEWFNHGEEGTQFLCEDHVGKMVIVAQRRTCEQLRIMPANSHAAEQQSDKPVDASGGDGAAQ